MNQDIQLTAGIIIDNAQLLNEATRARKTAEQALSKLNLRADFSSIQKGAADTKKQFNQLTDSAVDFSDSLERGLRRITALSAASAALFGISKAFFSSLEASRQLEKSLKEINVVLNLPTQQLKEFGKEIFDVARLTRQSLDEVTKAAVEFSRQGLGAEETLKRTQAALILVNLSGLDAARSTEAITAAINSFTKENLQAIDVVNKLVAVDSRFAVSSADLAEALTRVGSTAEDAGVGFDKLIAMVTAAQQVTQRGGSIIGNALKSIFQRLQREDTLKALEDLGVQVREVSETTGDYTGKLVSADQVLKQLATRFKDLTQEQRAQTSELVAGVFQGNVFRGILRGLAFEQDAYQTSLKATDDAVRRNAALLETQDAKIKKITTSLREAGANIGQVGFGDFLNKWLKGLSGEESTSKVANLGGSLIKALTGNLKGGDTETSKAFADMGNQAGRAFIKSFSDILLGPGLIAAGLIGVKIIQVLSKYTAATFKQANPFSKEDVSLQEQIDRLLTRQIGEIRQIVASTSDKVVQEQKILELFRAQNAVLAEQRAIRASVQPLLRQYGPQIIGATSNKKVPNLASGADIAEAFERERVDISNGVGGASSGARPVYLPDFEYNGSRGVVANTDEFLVPNFAGRPAIFNREMVKDYGFPNGARPINAASGTGVFVPENGGYKNVRDSDTRGFALRTYLYSLGVEDAINFEVPLTDILKKNRAVTKTLIDKGLFLTRRIRGKPMRAAEGVANLAKGDKKGDIFLTPSGEFRVVRTTDGPRLPISKSQEETVRALNIIGGYEGFRKLFGDKTNIQNLTAAARRNLTSASEAYRFPSGKVIEPVSSSSLTFKPRPSAEVASVFRNAPIGGGPAPVGVEYPSPSFQSSPGDPFYTQRQTGRQVGSIGLRSRTEPPLGVGKYSATSPDLASALSQRALEEGNKRASAGQFLGAEVSTRVQRSVQAFGDSLTSGNRALNRLIAGVGKLTDDFNQGKMNWEEFTPKSKKFLAAIDRTTQSIGTIGGEEGYKKLVGNKYLTDKERSSLVSQRTAAPSDVNARALEFNLKNVIDQREGRALQIAQLTQKIESAKIDGKLAPFAALPARLERALLKSNIGAMSPERINRFANAGTAVAIAAPFATEFAGNFMFGNEPDPYKKERYLRATSTAAQSLSTAGFIASMAPALGAGAPVALGLAGVTAAYGGYKAIREGTTVSQEEIEKRLEDNQNKRQTTLEMGENVRAQLLRRQEMLDSGASPQTITAITRSIMGNIRGISDIGLQRSLREFAVKERPSMEDEKKLAEKFASYSIRSGSQLSSSPESLQDFLNKNFSKIGGEGIPEEQFQRFVDITTSSGNKNPEDTKKTIDSLSKQIENARKLEALLKGAPEVSQQSVSFANLQQTPRAGILSAQNPFEGDVTLSSLGSNSRDEFEKRKAFADAISKVLTPVELQDPKNQSLLEDVRVGSKEKYQKALEYYGVRGGSKYITEVERRKSEFEKEGEQEASRSKILDVEREILKSRQLRVPEDIERLARLRTRAAGLEIGQEVAQQSGQMYGVPVSIQERTKLGFQRQALGIAEQTKKVEQGQQFSENYNNLLITNRGGFQTLFGNQQKLLDNVSKATNIDEFNRQISELIESLKPEQVSTTPYRELYNELIKLQTASQQTSKAIESETRVETSRLNIISAAQRFMEKRQAEKAISDTFTGNYDKSVTPALSDVMIKGGRFNQEQLGLLNRERQGQASASEDSMYNATMARQRAEDLAGGPKTFADVLRRKNEEMLFGTTYRAQGGQLVAGSTPGLTGPYADMEYDQEFGGLVPRGQARKYGFNPYTGERFVRPNSGAGAQGTPFTMENGQIVQRPPEFNPLSATPSLQAADKIAASLERGATAIEKSLQGLSNERPPIIAGTIETKGEVVLSLNEEDRKRFDGVQNFITGPLQSTIKSIVVRIAKLERENETGQKQPPQAP